MSKTETRKLEKRIWQLRITRRNKTPEYRQGVGMLLMGAIHACRTIEAAMKGGNEYADMVAELMRLREHNLTGQLRRL